MATIKSCGNCKYSKIGFLGFSKCSHPVISNNWELRGVVETNGNACKYFDKD
jgi:hypothetical protein